MLIEKAHAKVNLTLHVTARRADGYHLLESLVVFPDIGDTLTFQAAPELTLEVKGPRAADLAGVATKDNLILKAAQKLRSACDVGAGARITLEKTLPAAAGIGGGSADAAAALRGLMKLWSLAPTAAVLDAMALELGADVPVCLKSRAAMMSGIGERVLPVEGLPPFWLVLVNCGAAVPTGPVFKNLVLPKDTALAHPQVENIQSFSKLIEILTICKNDLQRPAMALEPQIQDCLAAIGQTPGAAFTAMSGSGATCFGLYENEADARKAEAHLRAGHPSWWVHAGSTRCS